MIKEIYLNILGRGPSRPSAKVVADSYPAYTEHKTRLTTLEVRMHRFVLAEFNTHRVFSRNSASSRAIPTYKRVRDVLTDLAWPVEWGTLQAGMQAGPPAIGARRALARTVWFLIALCCVAGALALRGLRIHKQITNRLLEPFLWHDVVVTSTEWENFFKQRASHHTKLAQPEMMAAADAIYEALTNSSPQPLDIDQWHLPYVDEFDWVAARNKYPNGYLKSNGYINYEAVDPDAREKQQELLIKVSIARCARSSYGTTKKQDFAKELMLYCKLEGANPPHWSPMEHVATPATDFENPPGNFKGWWQWRHYDERDLDEDFDAKMKAGIRQLHGEEKGNG